MRRRRAVAEALKARGPTSSADACESLEPRRDARYASPRGDTGRDSVVSEVALSSSLLAEPLGAWRRPKLKWHDPLGLFGPNVNLLGLLGPGLRGPYANCVGLLGLAAMAQGCRPLATRTCARLPDTRHRHPHHTSTPTLTLTLTVAPTRAVRTDAMRRDEPRRVAPTDNSSPASRKHTTTPSFLQEQYADLLRCSGRSQRSLVRILACLCTSWAQRMKEKSARSKIIHNMSCKITVRHSSRLNGMNETHYVVP